MYELVRLDAVDSVLDEARRRARDGADEGCLVWAGRQTAARTRRGRSWEAPDGNLHCALVLRPDYDDVAAAQLVYVMGVSVASAIAGLVSPMTGLRFASPTELLVNDLSAGRIDLAFAPAARGQREWMAIAVSVNVGWHPPNPEPETFNSLHASGSPEVTVPALLEDVSRYFLSWINRWADEGFEPVRRAWTARIGDRAEPVSIRVGELEARGALTGLDPAGNIRLRGDGDGERSVGLARFLGIA